MESHLYRVFVLIPVRIALTFGMLVNPFCALTSTASNAVWVNVGLATAQPPVLGDLYELEMGLTSSLGVDSTAPGTVIWQWQGRDLNRGQAWRNLMTADATVIDASTAYVENTYSGRLNPNDVLGKVPFEIQLLISSSSATAKGKGRIKNSTYIKAVTSSLYKRALD